MGTTEKGNPDTIQKGTALIFHISFYQEKYNICIRQLSLIVGCPIIIAN